MRIVLSNQNLFVMRRLSKRIRVRIDNFPEFVIQLSREGSISVSPAFFSSFHGIAAIKCHHGWCDRSGWFGSYLDAIHQGLHLKHTLQLVVNEDKLAILAENLGRSLKSRQDDQKVQNLILTLRGIGSNVEETFQLLASFHNLVQKLELRLEIAQQSAVALEKIVQHRGSLPDPISFVELAVRFASTS